MASYCNYKISSILLTEAVDLGKSLKAVGQYRKVFCHVHLFIVFVHVYLHGFISYVTIRFKIKLLLNICAI